MLVRRNRRRELSGRRLAIVLSVAFIVGMLAGGALSRWVTMAVWGLP